MKLQLSFDASFIDYIKTPVEDTENVTALTLSLLSAGNAYDLVPETISTAGLQTLGSNLLPWTWLNPDGELDTPDTIRIWKVENSPPFQSIDLEINDPMGTWGVEELKNIKAHFEKQLDAQISKPQELQFDLIDGKPVDDILIDDEQAIPVPVVGKAQSLIAQMSQRLFPSNQDLNLLFISKLSILKPTEIAFFNEGITDRTTFICFPVSSKPESIWFSTAKPEIFTEFCSLRYQNDRDLGGSTIEVVAYTKLLDIPNQNAASGNISLRENGEYVGNVTIELQQDNDWQVNFTEVLADVLELRDFFLKKETSAVIDAIVVDETEISRLLYYYIDPFLKVANYFDALAWLNLNTKLSKETTLKTQKETAAFAATATEAFYRLQSNVNSFLLQREEIKQIIRKLIYPRKDNEVQVDPFNTANYKRNGEKLQHDLSELFDKLNSTTAQQLLVSVFLQFHVEELKAANFDLSFDGVKISLKDKHVELISLQNLNLYAIANQHILKKAEMEGQNKTLLKHLVEGLDTFQPDKLKSIAEKIAAIYTPSADTVDLLKEFIFKDVEAADIIDFTNQTLKKYTDQLPKPTAEQLPLRIQLGKPSQIAPTSDEDDLADELSGYVLLGTRAKEINQSDTFEDWKYHNWAKANLISYGDRAMLEPTRGTTVAITSPFLAPSQLPEENNQQKIFVEIANAKLSLVANLTSINQSVTADVQEEERYMPSIQYYLHGQNSKENNPYALKYGYHYRYAALAILNSGILPAAIRNENEINQFKTQVKAEDLAKFKGCHYLRTKAISPPYVVHQAKAYPATLRPLFMELPIFDQLKQEDRKLIVAGDKFNDSFPIIIRKPSTTFWDCFSFTDNYLDYQHADGYLDPSIGNHFYVELKEINRIVGGKMEELSRTFPYVAKTAKGIPFENTIKVRLGTTAAEQITADTLHLLPGKVYQLLVYNLVAKKYFDDLVVAGQVNERRFHPEIDFGAKNEQVVDGVVYYQLSPQSYFLETAIHFNRTKAEKEVRAEQLWNELSFIDGQLDKASTTQSVKVFIEAADPKLYSVYSRVEVSHQKMDWNGRQPNINMEQLSVSLNPSPIYGSGYQLSDGMKLEAWWQSDRFDHTAIKTTGRLLSSAETRANLIHEYKAIIDNHAMYLKYAVQIFNRYEALGISYQTDSINSEIKVGDVGNRWKRYLKRSKREERLPAPAIRFWFPLTGALTESISDTSDVMLVLEDVWYKEGGLAEKLSIGIKSSSFDEKNYPEAGVDVTLSTSVTSAYDGTVTDGFIVVGQKAISGPVGFTFDYNAQLPKINSSSFVISGSALSKYLGDKVANEKQTYPMFNLAVRREMVASLHYSDRECTCQKNASGALLAPCSCGKQEVLAKIDRLKSEWSSSNWVQFIGVIDQFIPSLWKKKVRAEGAMKLTKALNQNLFRLDAIQTGKTDFDNQHNWYLIFSETQSDISGLPTERYYDTFLVTAGGLLSVHGEKKELAFEEGNLRIMVVRKVGTLADDHKIWEELFGNSDEQIQTNKKSIAPDNKLASPQITNKISIQIIS